MTVYNNKKAGSAIASVEFTTVSDGNFSFFTVKDQAAKAEVTQFLTSKEVGQEIIAETIVSGQPVFVTHGDKSTEALKQVLAAHGENLEFSHEAEPLNYWAIRGGLSVVGQSMQLMSGYMRQGGLDVGTMMFALCNLAANGINIMFGAQDQEDINRLRFLKTQFNKKLGKHLESNEALPGVDEKRTSLRHEHDAPSSAREKIHGFLERYSVSFGELGLRYLGALALAFPLRGKNWGKAMNALENGMVTEAYQAVRNNHRNGKANLDHYIGLTYLFGKSIALFTKVPDPYDSKPHTWLDNIREKYLFRTSSVIEGAGAAAISINAIKNKKIKWKGGITPDYLGGVGGLLFTAAFLVRYFAKFGHRHVDKEELYAHITDSLAKMPPNKLPQLIADSASTITEHFKDEKLDFGQVFTQMMSDLYRYHHIALDNLGTEPEERLADIRMQEKEASTEAQAIQAKRILKAQRKLPAETPLGTHQERVAKSDSPSIGLGA